MDCDMIRGMREVGLELTWRFGNMVTMAPQQMCDRLRSCRYLGDQSL